MGLKDLFIVSDEDDKKTKNSSGTKFPSTFSDTKDIMNSTPTNLGFPKATPAPAPTAVKTTGIPFEEHATQFREMYKNGFDGLNQQGFDFYEFFQSVIQGGVDNPQTYAMAMTMGSVMNKGMTKHDLITQADFYLNEINKVHTAQGNAGSKKKGEITTQKEHEKNTLTSDVANLKAQLEAIANQISAKEYQLSLIDNNYQPQLLDIDSKILANDLGKNELVSLIEKVKEGINKNLK